MEEAVISWQSMAEHGRTPKFFSGVDFANKIECENAGRGESHQA
jgi:hypothetical protein